MEQFESIFKQFESILSHFKTLKKPKNQLIFPIFQFIRLAFHDCLKYSDDLDGNQVNGCDGCLHPMGMNVDLMEKYEDARNAPNNLTFFTNNNGLTATADILEEG